MKESKIVIVFAIALYAITTVLYFGAVSVGKEPQDAADFSTCFAAIFVAAACCDVVRERMSRWRFFFVILMMTVFIAATEYLHQYFSGR